MRDPRPMGLGELLDVTCIGVLCFSYVNTYLIHVMIMCILCHVRPYMDGLGQLTYMIIRKTDNHSKRGIPVAAAVRSFEALGGKPGAE